jgi:hypothetical protein
MAIAEHAPSKIVFNVIDLPPKEEMSKCYAHEHLFDQCDNVSSMNRRCNAAMFLCHAIRSGMH